MAEMLVVRSKVKAYAAKKKMRLGGDAVSALSMEVERLVDRAAERATAAKAGTIKAKHV
jgi:hypothetical protein